MTTTRTIENFGIADFVSEVVKLSPSADSEYYWRGHSDSNHKLVPSIYRKKENLSEKEHLLIKEAILRHPEEFSSKRSHFEKLTLLQHYEFPTRLLDVTQNPLVALYFCCNSNPKKDGEVILFKIKRDSVRYFDSDTVTLLSAISTIPPEKFKDLNKELRDIFISEADPILKSIKSRLNRNTSQTTITTITNYLSGSVVKSDEKARIVELFNTSALIQTLIYEIRSEKPHFRPRIYPGHFNNSMIFVKSRYDNQRISAQQGAFLLYGIKDGDKKKPSEFEKSRIQIERIKVPSASKKEILRALSHFGISDERMFPEMTKSASVIKRKLKI